MNEKNRNFSFFLILLICFLIYSNFALQRIELFLTNLLGGFPFPYVILLVFFILLILVKKTTSKCIIFDKKIIKFILFVFVIVSLQTLFTFLPIENISNDKGKYFQFLSIVYIYFPLLTAIFTYLVVNNRKQIYSMINLTILMSVLQSIIGIFMFILPDYLIYLMGWEQLSNNYRYEIRFFSPIIGGSGPLSFIILITLPFVYSMYLISQKKSVYLILFFSLFISLILTYSRGPILIFTFLLIWISICFHLKCKTKISNIIFVILIFLVGIFLIFPYLPIDESYLMRYNLGSADSNRYYSFITAIKLIKKNPFIGSGSGQLYIRAYENSLDKEIFIGSNYSLKTPHNFFLLIAAENGLIILCLWIFFIVYILKSVSVNKFSNTKDKALRLSFLFSLLSTFIFSLISDTIAIQYRISPMFWFIVGLAMAHSRIMTQARFEKSKAFNFYGFNSPKLCSLK